MKPRIFVTRKLPKPGLDLLNQYFTVTLNTEDRILTPEEIREGIRDKEALLCLLTDNIDKSILDAANTLKVISNYAVGFNNIDIEEATRRQIPVCITPGILTDATADLTWSLILAVARRIVSADRYMREDQFTGWDPTLFLGLDLRGKTLGIIGMGRIGQAVAARAQGFGMEVLYTSRTPKPIQSATQCSLEVLLRNADVISLHTALTPETHHLIGREAFKQMKRTAILINTARGPIIDETALLEALQTQQIFGAGLDVFEHEPRLTPGLNECDNLVMLPHIGSATEATRTEMAKLAAENAIAILEGNQPHALANPTINHY